MVRKNWKSEGRDFRFMGMMVLVCRWECRASWFDFSSESSTKSGTGITTGDFTVLSHLKELGCGELLRRPREIHFSGCINESYAFQCSGGDFFVKINRLSFLCHFLNHNLASWLSCKCRDCHFHASVSCIIFSWSSDASVQPPNTQIVQLRQSLSNRKHEQFLLQSANIFVSPRVDSGRSTWTACLSANLKRRYATLVLHYYIVVLFAIRNSV